MTNEERANLDFISQLTDVSKWDLAGLNSVTGYKDPEETSGIEDLENLAKEMEARENLNICSSCGESETPGFLDVVLQNVDGEFYCETCIQKEIDRIDTLEAHLRSVDLDSISRDIESQGYLNGRNY